MTFRAALLALFVLAPAARAQSAPDPVRLADSLSRELDAAWLAGDQPRFASAQRMLDRAVTLFPKDALLVHYKGYALYRQLQGQPEPTAETRERILTEALAAFAESVRLKPMAESYVLRRSLLAQTISDAGSAMAVAPQMQQAEADAMRLGKENPRVWLVQGVGAFFTPPMYGGGPEAALADLSKAATIFKTDRPAKAMPSWGHAEVHAWLGIVHQKLGRTDEARKAYREALRLEPSFGWVKDVLLPGLEKGIQPFP